MNASELVPVLALAIVGMTAFGVVRSWRGLWIQSLLWVGLVVAWFASQGFPSGAAVILALTGLVLLAVSVGAALAELRKRNERERFQ